MAIVMTVIFLLVVLIKIQFITVMILLGNYFLSVDVVLLNLKEI